MSGLMVAAIAGAVFLMFVVGYVALRRRRKRQRQINLTARARVRAEIPDDEFWKRRKREPRRQTRAERAERRGRVHS